MTRPQKLLALLGLAAGAFAILNRKTILKVSGQVVDASKALAYRAAFTAATPHGRAAQYTDVVLKVASEEQVSPFLIVAIMEHESLSGTALIPPGPGGAGDGGHGRGLMQLDDHPAASSPSSLHRAVLNDGRWKEPYWNMKAAIVDHIKPDTHFFTAKGLKGDALLRATIAAFNAGAGNVWKRIAAGQDPDDATTGGNYSADVVSRLASLSLAFAQKAG